MPKRPRHIRSYFNTPSDENNTVVHRVVHIVRIPAHKSIGDIVGQLSGFYVQISRLKPDPAPPPDPHSHHGLTPNKGNPYEAGIRLVEKSGTNGKPQILQDNWGWDGHPKNTFSVPDANTFPLNPATAASNGVYEPFDDEFEIKAGYEYVVTLKFTHLHPDSTSNPFNHRHNERYTGWIQADFTPS
jgi:hypothetical protein